MKFIVRVVFVAKEGLLVESLHLPRHARIICPVVRSEGDECLQVGHQLLSNLVGCWNMGRSCEANKSSAYKLVEVCVFGHPVHVHVLQRRKIMENIEENVVEQGVVLYVVIKLQSVVVCSICKSLFVVKETT